jgi:hypothetical protein
MWQSCPRQVQDFKAGAVDIAVLDRADVERLVSMAEAITAVRDAPAARCM